MTLGKRQVLVNLGEAGNGVNEARMKREKKKKKKKKKARESGSEACGREV